MGTFRGAATGKRSIESLVSARQREFAKAYATVVPDGSRLKVLIPARGLDPAVGQPSTTRSALEACVLP